MNNYINLLNKKEYHIFNKKYKYLDNIESTDDLVLMCHDSFYISNDSVYHHLNLIYFIPTKLKLSSITDTNVFHVIKKINFLNLRHLEICSNKIPRSCLQNLSNKLFYLGFKTNECVYNFLNSSYITSFNYLPNSIKIIENDDDKKHVLCFFPNKLKIFKTTIFYKQSNIKKLPINCTLIAGNLIIKNNFKRKLFA
jgi:hypothetical protein